MIGVSGLKVFLLAGWVFFFQIGCLLVSLFFIRFSF